MSSYRLLKADDVTEHDYDDNRPKCKGDTTMLPDRWVACWDCRRYRLVRASCGQRNCGHCQLKRSVLEYERYFPALQQIDCGGMGRKWVFVTLTGYRVPVDNVGQNAYMMMDDAVRFLKGWFLGGLVVVEHTYKPADNEYYIHAHALVIGDYVNNRIQREHGLTDFEMFGHEWGRHVSLTSMHFTPVNKITGRGGNPRTVLETITAGLTYVLKYISKGVALRDDDLYQVKRLRYIRTFGEVYKVKKPKVVSRCKFCYNGDLRRGKLELLEDWQVQLIIDQGEAKGPEALETMRVLSWSGRVIDGVKESVIELKKLLDEQLAWLKTKFKVWRDRYPMVLEWAWLENRIYSVMPSCGVAWYQEQTTT